MFSWKCRMQCMCLRRLNKQHHNFEVDNSGVPVNRHQLIPCSWNSSWTWLGVIVPSKQKRGCWSKEKFWRHKSREFSGASEKKNGGQPKITTRCCPRQPSGQPRTPPIVPMERNRMVDQHWPIVTFEKENAWLTKSNDHYVWTQGQRPWMGRKSFCWPRKKIPVVPVRKDECWLTTDRDFFVAQPTGAHEKYNVCWPT